MPILDEAAEILKTGRVVAQVATGVTSAAAITAAAGIGLAGYGVYAWLVSDGVLDKIGAAIKAVGAGLFGGPATWMGGTDDTQEGHLSTPEGEKTYQEQYEEAYGG